MYLELRKGIEPIKCNKTYEIFRFKTQYLYLFELPVFIYICENIIFTHLNSCSTKNVCRFLKCERVIWLVCQKEEEFFRIKNVERKEEQL